MGVLTPSQRLDFFMTESPVLDLRGCVTYPSTSPARVGDDRMMKLLRVIRSLERLGNEELGAESSILGTRTFVRIEFLK
jgi:hypothetical protein